ncbi:MAG: hypothetical protein LBH42_04835, partial [Treponema sp.]|nr:hypothetical protein [Treponema sp.]
MSCFKRLILALVLSLSIPTPGLAYAFVCANCSTNFMQMLEYAQSASQLMQLYEQVYQSYQQTVQQIQIAQTNMNQYANMLQNTKQLPANMLAGLKGNLNDLASLTSQLDVQRGEITSLGRIFNTLYPGRELFEGQAKASTPEEVAAANAAYEKYYNDMSAQVDRASM